MRAFLALPLQSETAANLFERRELLRGGFKKVRWVPPCNLHITLFFLGDISRAQAEEIGLLLEDLSERFISFPIELIGPGQFPPKGKPRIIYEGLGKGAAEAKRIYSLLMPRLDNIVNLEKRKYIPHITLGRTQNDSTCRFLDDNIYHLETVSGKISGMTLFESLLRSTGAEYYPVKQITFKEEENHEGR